MTFKYFEPNLEALERDRAKDAREAADSMSDGPKPFLVKPGVTTARILPPFNERGVWYREVREYALKVDGQWTFIPSPSQYRLPDPIAEFRKELLASGAQEQLEFAKSLTETKKYLFNALIYNAPAGVEFDKKNVVVLKTGISVKRSLLELDQDVAGGWADITNLENGVNLRISRTGAKLNTSYDVRPLPQRTSVIADLAAIGVDINSLSLYDLDSLYQSPVVDKLNDIVESYRAELGSPRATVSVPATLPTRVPANLTQASVPNVSQPAPVLSRTDLPKPASARSVPVPAQVLRPQTVVPPQAVSFPDPYTTEEE